MEVLKGHFDGKQVVIDDPVPADLAPDTPVKIVVDRQPNGTVLQRLARLAGPGHGLPRDYAEQHEHYNKGTPRK